MSATGWVVLGVLAVLLVWTVTVYNRLVQLRNRIANALGQIDVQLKRRYDLIPNLVEVARGYLQHEASTLEAVIQARGQALQHLFFLRAHEQARFQRLGRARRNVGNRGDHAHRIQVGVHLAHEQVALHAIGQQPRAGKVVLHHGDVAVGGAMLEFGLVL